MFSCFRVFLCVCVCWKLNRDLSAIPNSEPGQCVSSELLHHSCAQEPGQCDATLAKSAIVYGDNDAECRGKTGRPMDPGGWYEWQFGAPNGNWSLVPSWGTDGCGGKRFLCCDALF